MIARAVALLLFASTPALAVDCYAVGGHFEGQPAWLARHIDIAGDDMILRGDFGERYSVACQSLSPGLWCQGMSGELEVTIIANGTHLLESIADPRTGRERLGLSYVCEGDLQTAR